MTLVDQSLPSARASKVVARKALLKKYRRRIEVNPDMTRRLVSYQSNRNRPFDRWLKYKEGFSAELVEYLLKRLAPRPGVLLDPFAGSGAALFAARSRGWDVRGIELLPVGIHAIGARLAALSTSVSAFRGAVARFNSGHWRRKADPALALRHVPITVGAFSDETEADITSFRTFARDSFRDKNVRLLLEAACLSVLESVSFTCKDGQYLRWDSRAPRKLPGRGFKKRTILSLETALNRQLNVMLEDMTGAPDGPTQHETEPGEIVTQEGSCLELLPRHAAGSVDLVITSPPYCNRYDYTRTYALELAYLGVDQERLKQLRQSLLSCTVENRSKLDALAGQYKTARGRDLYRRAVSAFQRQEALGEVLDALQSKAKAGMLNNVHIPRMVENYFLESAVVIFELARVVRPGGIVVMVNDNVQYVGEEVPVDLILSELADEAGFVTERIWTLGRGKGNSSQQMGVHGRNELRKCAYVWRRRE